MISNNIYVLGLLYSCLLAVVVFGWWGVRLACCGWRYGKRFANFPHNIFMFWASICSRKCVVLIMSQGSAVAGSASGRDRQHGQSATNGKAKDNGGKARDKDGQTYFRNAHNSVFL